MNLVAVKVSKDLSTKNYDQKEVFVIPFKGKKNSPLTKLPDTLSFEDAKIARAILTKKKDNLKPGSILFSAMGPMKYLVVLSIPENIGTYSLLSLGRKLANKAASLDLKKILVHMDLLDEEFSKKLADSLVTSFNTTFFKYSKDSKKNQKKPKLKILPIELEILSSKESLKELREIANRSLLESNHTNRIRELTLKPGNILDCKGFTDLAKTRAKAHQLKFTHINFEKLEKLKAGAFLAVAKGANHKHSGIVQLSYKPTSKKRKKHIALVGKGVVFDIGGVNVKPATYMNGMNGDMAGAAAALELICLASEANWPIEITAYLAISDNAISPSAYKPNDVVTSLNGTTIEIIHTDAEGRMVLADTLSLASQSKPDLIVDFATLTGSCVAALGINYSGAFTNIDGLKESIIIAGDKSGERVWPFPMDEDYGDCLESKVADTKQCRLDAGPDHIEAALFLKKFIADDIDWIHLDLSSSQSKGTSGHMEAGPTGFGVRFCSILFKEMNLI